MARCARVWLTSSPMKLPLALGWVLLAIRKGWKMGTKVSGGRDAAQAFITSYTLEPLALASACASGSSVLMNHSLLPAEVGLDSSIR